MTLRRQASADQLTRRRAWVLGDKNQTADGRKTPVSEYRAEHTSCGKKEKDNKQIYRVIE